MTDPLGQSQVIPYLQGLSKKGYKITILSAEKKINYFANNDKIKKLLESNNINWNPIFYTKKPPVLSTILDIQKLKKEAKKLHKKNQFSIVHCRSYIAAFVGLYLKNKYDVKFIFDMRGFYADERVDGNLWNRKNKVFNAVYKYFKRKEIDFLLHADYTVTLTNAAKRIIHNWTVFDVAKPKIEVIPCCADLDHFSMRNIKVDDQEKLKSELKINKNNFIVSYLGSLGTWYLANEMMQFFKCLLKVKPDARFFLITPDCPKTVFQLAKKNDVPESAIIVRKAERNKVPLFLSISDFSLFFIKPVFSKKASSPTKMGEIMGMGIPIICNAGVGDVDEYLSELNPNLLVNTFAETEYIRTINLILQKDQIPVTSILDLSKKYFSLQNGIEKYDSVYKHVIED